MIEVGTIVSPLAPSTINMIIALDARFLSGLISCNSDIAFSPIGVAALSKPSTLADTFISIEPNTLCPLGTSGKIRLKNGATPLLKVLITPPCSPIFIIPVQKVSTPVRPSASSKPVLALVKVELSSSEKISV